MKLDFWNNPLVVSALRVRYRQGGILRLSIVWMLVLVGVGMLSSYFRAEIEPPYQMGIPWHQFYFFVLYGIQWVVSCATAAFSVVAAVQSEVSNRTLDFQRLAAISPRQLLLGKMLGEPIQAYLLAMTSFPLAVWCWSVGVPGLTLPVLLLLYLNLFTAIFMFSAGSLVNKLELKDGKVQGGNVMGLLIIGAGASVVIPLMGGVGLLTSPAAATAFSLVLPAAGFFGLVHGDAFQFPVSLFGLSAPGLFVTPLCQLAAAAFFFRMMERRFRDALAPALSKPMAYGLLVGADLLAAGVIGGPGTTTADVQRSAAIFCAAHLIVSLALTSLTIPSYEAVASWAWRFRGRSPWWRDSLWGERSPPDLTWPAFGMIGLVTMIGLIVWPAVAQNGVGDLAAVAGVALPAWGLAALLTLLAGSLTQWLAFFMRAEASPGIVVLMAAVDGVVHSFAFFYDLDWLKSLSASAVFASWIDDSPVYDASWQIVGSHVALSPWALLGICAALVPLGWGLWRRSLRRLVAAVDAQLRQMKASPG